MRERELSALKGAGGFFCGPDGTGPPSGAGRLAGVPGKPGGFCSPPRRAGSGERAGARGLARTGLRRPCGGEPPMKIGGLRGGYSFQSKNILALPRKIPGDFDFRDPFLKRPKERPGGLLLWKPLFGWTGERGVTGDGGTGMGAVCSRHSGISLAADEIEEGLVVLAEGLVGEGPAGDEDGTPYLGYGLWPTKFRAEIWGVGQGRRALRVVEESQTTLGRGSPPSRLAARRIESRR